MHRVLLAALLTAVTASADLALSTDTGKPVLTWTESDTVFEYLEVRASLAPFEEGDVNKGSALRKILPEREGPMPTSIEIPVSFVVDPDVCIGCRLCITQCPIAAISLVDGKAMIDPETCIACGLCVVSCPVGAIYSPTDDGIHFALVGVTSDGRRVMLETF